MSAAVSIHDAVVMFRGRGDTVRAIDTLQMSIEPSEYVTVIGSNGAGKSTMVNLIAGEVRPESGAVLVGGLDVTSLPDHRRARAIGRVFQDVTAGTCAGLSIAENMAMAQLRRRRRSPMRPALSRGRLRALRDEMASLGGGLEHRITKPAGTLSGGQRQLVSLVMATMGDPDVLLLDEHTSALDPGMAEMVMNRTDAVIRDRGLTAVMVTHNMRHAATYGDRVLIMSRGRIVDDIAGRERQRLTEDSLIARFRSLAGADLSDRIIGA
jgi:putative ABC transport system ATP-binding protein